MSVESHLGISLREYDRRIRTFIPRYEEMLDAAAGALRITAPGAKTIVDLGTGTGALAKRCLAAAPRARVIGIDSDAGMLAVARRRLGARMDGIAEDFTGAALPRCDAMTASFSLHHIAARAAKQAFYKRMRRSIRPGGVFISADCYPASAGAIDRTDRRVWQAHLEKAYPPKEASRYLAAWRRQDVYVPLTEECAMLARAGFEVDVAWRQGAFAVVVGLRP
ncbi:MAG: class I SAM-dependent methyltransferase [Acidobacteriota bacterium]|nr:class I SAM-dependent methyltransferase [Acidobacteriota bacterium]